MSVTDPHETYAADLAAELREAEDGISAEDAHYDYAGPNPGHAWANNDNATPQCDDPWQQPTKETAA